MRYKLKQRWAESGVIIRGVTGVITKDNFTDEIARKICALGLAQRFLDIVEEDKKVPDVQPVTEEKVKATRPRKRRKVTEKTEKTEKTEEDIDENQSS